MSGPKNVTLRTGAEVPDVLLRTTAVALRTLMAEHPVALYEAVMVARDKTHEPFGNTGEALRGFGFLDSAGKMHDAIRDIILASAEGDGFDIGLVSPYAATEAQS